MAYVLGFFAADGTMIVNKRGAHFIEFHITDREILKKIKKVMGSEHKISIRDEGNANYKLGYRLQIGSKEMFVDLSKHGFTPNKSKIIKFPHVPQKFLGDFVRGYFDGDGCIYFKKHRAKDRRKARWVFSSRFTSGSKKFLLELHNQLRPMIKKGTIYDKRRGFELVLSHHDSVALYKLMYHNDCQSLYLDRKYRLFHKAISTLYGMK
jgi:intein-encoded DNA endonuclease-like protein